MAVPPSPQQTADTPLESTGLNPRIVRVYKRAAIETVGQLSLYTPRRLMKLRNIADGSVGQTRMALAEYSATLREEPETVMDKVYRLGLQPTCAPVDALPLHFHKVTRLHAERLHTLGLLSHGGLLLLRSMRTPDQKWLISEDELRMMQLFMMRHSITVKN